MKETLKKIVIAIITWESKIVLRRYKPKIIAVTGSVGKTSTKDAIYTALIPYAHVRKSEKSYNSEFGVPLSVLGLPNGWNNPFIWARTIIAGLWMAILPAQYPEWLVLEVGADKPGDIKSLAKWLKPDVVVITRFPDVPVHIEFFESKEHVIEEKTALAESLKPDGLLILNGDDPMVARLYGKYGKRTVLYGLNQAFHAWGKDLKWSYVNENGKVIPRGREWTLVTPEIQFIVSQPFVIGESHIVASLAALAVIYGLGFPLEKAVEALTQYRTPPGRLSLLAGKNGSLIVDDTYNSSPIAAQSAINLLREVKVPGRKIAILGDMMELGKYGQEAHHILGTSAVGSADFLITVGIRAKEIDKGAEEAKFAATAIRHFDTAEQAGDFLAGMIGEGDLILIKGSQSVRLERAVKMLMAEQEKASELLVRQEKEWENR